MAEANGRYQSRLFRFVYKQSRRFTSSCDRLSGYIQNTAGWVAAVGLYPLMLLFQSRRSLAQQIDQAVQQNPQLIPAETDPEPFCVDTPIQRVLLSIDALSSEPTISTEQLQKPQPLKNFLAFFAPWRFDRKISQLEHRVGESVQGRGGEENYQSPTTNYQLPTTNYQSPISNYQSTRLVIQGIATQLTSQTLVLVTAHNEILDILTSTQQEKIQAQILSAVADYWRYQRKLGRLEEKNSLALTLRSVLAFLDRTIAKVETNHLIEVKTDAIAPKPNKETPYVLSSSKGELERLQTSSGAIFYQGKSAAINPSGSSTRDTIRIVALIRAAVDYFFGIGNKPIERTLKSDSRRLNPNFTESASGNRPGRSSNSQSQPLQIIGRDRAAKLSWAKSSEAYLPAGSQSVNPDIEDPWLCESDLFGEWVAREKLSVQPQQSRSQTRLSRSRLVPSLGSTRFSLGSLVDKWGKFLFRPKPASEIVTNSVKKNKLGVLRSLIISSDRSLDSTQQFPLFKSPQQSTSTQFTNRNSSTDIQPSPDWIETNATVVGYVKHPLEQLLTWLDLAMLWLEDILLLIWHWLRQLGARVRRGGERGQRERGAD